MWRACAGSFLDLSKLASEAGVARQSAVRFFEILEDTLIVRARSLREERPTTPGPAPALLLLRHGGTERGMELRAFSRPHRLLMEHLVFNQIVHTASSLDRTSVSRRPDGARRGVDFIVETKKDIWAVE